MDCNSGKIPKTMVLSLQLVELRFLWKLGEPEGRAGRLGVASDM